MLQIYLNRKNGNNFFRKYKALMVVNLKWMNERNLPDGVARIAAAVIAVQRRVEEDEIENESEMAEETGREVCQTNCWGPALRLAAVVDQDWKV